MAKRRGNHEGAIYQRPNGRWQAQVSLNGRRVTKSFATQKEGRAWIKKITKQKDQGLTYKAAKLLVSEYLGSWLQDTKSHVKPNTWMQYEGIVRNHLNPNIGSAKLTTLTPAQIQKLYTSKIENGVSARTVRLIHSVLHRALQIAYRQGYINTNPAKAVQKPILQSKELTVLDSSQIQLLLITAQGQRLESLYHLAVTTGMRQGELLGLNWGDLDWETGLLHVHRQLQRITGQGVVFMPPKTKAGKRTIDLGFQSLQQLYDHRQRQLVEMQVKGSSWKEFDLIFPSTIGTPLDQRNLYRDFKSLLKNAALADMRFHDLRHTAASLMLMNGIPPIKVSQRLGHSKTSVTLDIYGHFIPSMESNAGTLMDEIVTPIAADLQQQKEHVA